MDKSHNRVIRHFLPLELKTLTPYGTVWRVGVSPWSRMNPECYRSKKPCYIGIELEILDIIAQMVNASLEFFSTEVLGCGEYRNGTWYGLKGMLLMDQIDITGNLCNVETDMTTLENFSTFSYPVIRYQESHLMFLLFVCSVRFSSVCFLFLKILCDKYILKINFSFFKYFGLV